MINVREANQVYYHILKKLTKKHLFDILLLVYALVSWDE